MHGHFFLAAIAAACAAPSPALPDAFRGIGRDVAGVTEEALPLVHCYCFSAEDAAQDGWLRVGAALGVDMRGRATRAHKVRSVAPGKDMYCLEFRLPLDAALAPPTYR